MNELNFRDGVARGASRSGRWGGGIEIQGRGQARLVGNVGNRRPYKITLAGKTIACLVPVTTHAQFGWQILGSPHPEDAWLPDLSSAALRACRRWLTAQT